MECLLNCSKIIAREISVAKDVDAHLNKNTKRSNSQGWKPLKTQKTFDEPDELKSLVDKQLRFKNPGNPSCINLLELRLD